MNTPTVTPPVNQGPSSLTATPKSDPPKEAPKEKVITPKTPDPVIKKEQPKKEEPVVLRVILSQDQVEAQLNALIARFQESVHANALEKGFWENPNQAEKIALIHSEVSEALEGIRKGNPPDDKVPEFNETETELADALIRIFDFAHYYKLRVSEAMIAKHKFNLTRPYKHGKSF